MTILVNYCGTEELAELFGVARRTVDNWAKRGLIPKPSKIGGRNRHPIQPTLQAALDAGLKMSDETRQLILENLT